MKRYLVADPERNQTVEASKRCVARRPVNNVTSPKEKARKISAVLPRYPGYEGHWSSRRHATRRTAARSTLGIGRVR